MIDVRRFADHPHTNVGWLDAHHHFNFGHHRKPGRNGWGRLLVWNDDTIEPGTGFDLHPHRDMEIVTYVREGAITHRDHLGNEGRTEAGDVQVMSAGTGIAHAEHNRESEITRIFQIWVLPDEEGGDPRWDQARFPRGDRANVLVPLASGQNHEGALPIRADAAIFGATLTAGHSLTHELAPDRYAYIVAAKGSVRVNGVEINDRDGAAIRHEDALTIEASGEEPAEILLADIPGY